MGRRGKRRKQASLGTLLCLLAAMIGRTAVAQDVLNGTNMFSGAQFGSVGASAFGAGPFGTSGFGITSPFGTPQKNATDLGLSAGLGETDNVLLAPGAKESETLATAGVDVDLSRNEPRLNASAIGNFEDLYYLENAFGNELIGSFSGAANVGVVPNRLNWAIDESFGQNQLNPLEPTVSTNLQNVNIFSTGPDLLLHPGGQSNFLELGGRYARADYGSIPFSGYQGIGLFALGHDLSQTSALAVHVTDQQMYFYNTTLNQNYTLRKAYGSYTVQGARTSIELDAGAGQVDDIPGSSSEWSTRPIAQIKLTRQLSPTMSLYLQVGRQVTDPADSFATLQNGAGGAIVIAPVYETTSSYLGTFGSLGWTFTLHRTSISATASWARSSYDASSIFDTTIQDYEVLAQRRLTQRLALQVTGMLAKTNYYQAQYESDQRTANVALQWTLGPRLFAAFQYQYTSQGTSGLFQELTRVGYFNLISTSSVYLSDTYAANSVFITLTYVPIAE